METPAIYRIAPYDRVQALVRTPEHQVHVIFLKGCGATGACPYTDCIFRLNPTASTELMATYAKRWGVGEGVLIDDSIAALSPEEIEKLPLFDDTWIIQIVPESSAGARHKISTVKHPDFPDQKIEKISISYAQQAMRKSYHLRDERFLKISLRLDANKKTLSERFNKIVKDYYDSYHHNSEPVFENGSPYRILEASDACLTLELDMHSTQRRLKQAFDDIITRYHIPTKQSRQCREHSSWKWLVYDQRLDGKSLDEIVLPEEADSKPLTYESSRNRVSRLFIEAKEIVAIHSRPSHE